MRATLPLPSQPMPAPRAEPAPASNSGVREGSAGRPPGFANPARPAFARMLQEQQQSKPSGPIDRATSRDSAPEVAAADADGDTAAPAPATPDDTTPDAKAPRGAKSKPAQARMPHVAGGEKAEPPEDERATDPETTPAAHVHDDPAAIVATGLTLAVGERVPLPPAAGHASAPGAAADADERPADAAGGAAWSAVGQQDRRAGEALPAAATAAATDSAGTLAAATPSAFGRALAAEKAGPSRSDETKSTAGLDKGAVPSPAAAPTPSFFTVATSPASPTLAVAVPVDSPDFMPAFALQVSILASTGAQHAELQLHPAEMGPVSVQISLEGKEARVNFGADSALTRQLIEAGLPDLAGALREAGFTLTGGGVSAHADGRGSAEQRQGSRQGDAPAGNAAATPLGPMLTLRQPVRAGGIDLYA